MLKGKIKKYVGNNPPSASDDDLALEELRKYEKAKRKRYRANTRLRRELSEWARMVVSLWLLFVILALTLNDGRLSDQVLMTLLGTTTLNILGLMAIVLKGLFDREENPK